MFQSLVSLLPDMRTETADVLNEINTYFTQLHSVLQAREKQLTMEVYQAFKSGLEPLQSLVSNFTRLPTHAKLFHMTFLELWKQNM